MWLKNKRIDLLIFAMLFIAGAAFYHPAEYDNTASRYALLSAIVDHGTLNIDAFHNDTIDRAQWKGHYYSNKAPGASFLGIPVYWILRNLTPFKDIRPMVWLDMYIVRVVTTTLLFALLGVVMYRLALHCGAVPRQALMMIMAYGFGTIALLHTALFSGHQIAASCSFFSFALLVCCSSNNRAAEKNNWFWGLLAGCFAGVAVLSDYTAIVIAVCLAAYAVISRCDIRLKAGFVISALLCAVVLAAYNTACFDNPFSFSYEHQSYEKFREGTLQGILGVGLPQLTAMITLLISPSRGLFFIMPILLLSFWGLSGMIGGQKLQREGIFTIVVVIVSFLFVAGFYGWHGGWSFGPRYLVPMLPFLAFPLAFFKGRSYLFWLLFFPACVQVVFSVIGVPHCPEPIVNPIVEIIIPCISYDYTALNAGMLLGLAWPWSVVFVITLVGLLAVWAFHETNLEKSTKVHKASFLSVSFLVLWFCMIPVVLVFAKTDASVEFHQLRTRIIEDFAVFFNNEGIKLGEQNKYQQAIEEFSKAIFRKPSFAEAYNNRGFSYLTIGQYQQAIEDYSEAIRLKPDFLAAYINRGTAYWKQGNHFAGCQDAETACKLGNCETLKSAERIGLCR
jgi:hypothetical protein